MSQNNLIRLIVFLLLTALIVWAVNSANAAEKSDFDTVKEAVIHNNGKPIYVNATERGLLYIISVSISVITDYPEKPQGLILMAIHNTPAGPKVGLARIDLSLDGTVDLVMHESQGEVQQKTSDQNFFDKQIKVVADSLKE